MQTVHANKFYQYLSGLISDLLSPQAAESHDEGPSGSCG